MSASFSAFAAECLLSIPDNLGNFAQHVVFILEIQENPNSFIYQYSENWNSKKGIDMLRASFSSPRAFIPKVVIKKLPQTEYLNRNLASVLEIRSLELRYGQGHLQKIPEKISSWFVSASGISWHPLACIILIISASIFCEMKISPAILIKRNVTTISDFWPPTVNGSSQTVILLPPSVVITKELRECRVRWPRKQDWPQIAVVHMNEMNSVSPGACVFPHIKC